MNSTEWWKFTLDSCTRHYPFLLTSGGGNFATMNKSILLMIFCFVGLLKAAEFSANEILEKVMNRNKGIDHSFQLPPIFLIRYHAERRI